MKNPNVVILLPLFSKCQGRIASPTVPIRTEGKWSLVVPRSVRAFNFKATRIIVSCVRKALIEKSRSCRYSERSYPWQIKQHLPQVTKADRRRFYIQMDGRVLLVTAACLRSFKKRLGIKTVLSN